MSSELQVVTSIQSLKKSMQAWQGLSFEQREIAIKQFSQVLQAHRQALIEASVADQKISQSFLEEFELNYAIKKFANPKLSPANGFSTGIISIILSWQCPLRLLAERVVPALYYGNGVLLKLSSRSLNLTKEIKRLLEESQFPEGIISLIQGPGSEVGPILCSHPSIKAVAFVGHNNTAKFVAELAIKSSKKLSLSMGAKNAAILIDKVLGPEALQEVTKACLVGQGQLAWNLSRIFILEAEVDNFILSFGESIKTFLASQQYLSLIDEKAKARFVSKKSEIISEGGKIVFDGGEQGPLIVKDLHMCSTLQIEEQSLPIILVNTVKYLHEIPKWVNTSDLAFMHSIWSQDVEKAHRLAEKLEAGTVFINKWVLPGEDLGAGAKSSAYGFSQHECGLYFNRRQLI